MKKILMILLVLTAFTADSGAHENDFCNFTVIAGEGIQWEESYKIQSFSFKNVKARHARKLLKELAGLTTESITVNLHEFQKKLGNVCRFKKYELDKVTVTKSNDGVNLDLGFVPLVIETKSKSG